MAVRALGATEVASRRDRVLGSGRALLATAAWWLLGYTALVILWGAFVRATGAGAGCGSHWPLCNGEVLPRSPSAETLIELGHRATSGLLGVFVLGFVAAAFALYPRAHAVRRLAVLSLLFVVAEALIGAGLVHFEWVAANDSVERVVVMAFHLVNTFLLLGVMTLTAWRAGADENEHRRFLLSGRASLVARIGLALAAVLLVGASGAVTALGDTLLLTEGVTPESSPLVAQLVRSRFYHPSAAIAAFAIVGAALLSLRESTSRAGARYGWTVIGLFLAQLALGGANVLLMAPVWMQLVHLAVSDLLWILLVLFAAETLTRNGKSPSPAGEGLSPV